MFKSVAFNCLLYRKGNIYICYTFDSKNCNPNRGCQIRDCILVSKQHHFILASKIVARKFLHHCSHTKASVVICSDRTSAKKEKWVAGWRDVGVCMCGWLDNPVRLSHEPFLPPTPLNVCQ